MTPVPSMTAEEAEAFYAPKPSNLRGVSDQPQEWAQRLRPDQFPATLPEGWRPLAEAPEDCAVILATDCGWHGEASMLVDEDTGEQRWIWGCLGGSKPISSNYTPLCWHPMPAHPFPTLNNGSLFFPDDITFTKARGA